MNTQTLTIEIGYIGHKAEQLQALFPNYNTEGEYYLRFENITYIGNKGVICYTNCFESEEHFNETLQTKLLFNL